MMIVIIFVTLLIVMLVELGVILWFGIDWRDRFTKEYAPDYHKGYALVIPDRGGNTISIGEWVKTEFVSAAMGAMSYRRYDPPGKKDKMHEFTDVMPDSEGFNYDRYNGRRIYLVKPGGIMGIGMDRAGFYDYPRELLSMHVEDRNVVAVANSYRADKPMSNLQLIVIVIAIVIAVFMAYNFFFAGGSKEEIVKPSVTESNTSIVEPQPGVVYGKPLESGNETVTK